MNRFNADQGGRAPTATMGRLTRYAVSSGAATAVDLVLLMLLAQGLHLWPWLAGATAALAGGLVNFALSRRWVFNSRGTGWGRQVLRYLTLVVLIGALWAGALLQLIVVLLGLPLVLAKAGASALVLGCWNYPVSARLVFGKES